MLNWLFKKRPAPAAPAPAPAAPPPRNPAPAAAPRPPAPVVDWPALLQAAQGDDTALLALLQQPGAPLDMKTAAVAALAGEAALRQAEVALRERDRKVHRLAKQRLGAAVAQREARAQAGLLLQRAGVLAADEQLPINHLVDLDRAWNALPQDTLEPSQREQFAALRAQLDAGLQAREAARQALARWHAEAQAMQAEAATALQGIAAQGTAAEAQALLDRLNALLPRRPDVPATAAEGQALQRLAASAESLLPHLAWLDAPTATAPELPAPADAALAATIAQRVHMLLAPPPQAEPAAPPPPPPAPRPPRLSPEQRDAVASHLQQGEAGLAEGRLSDLQRHLQAIDATLGTQDLAALPDALRGPLQALRAEASRLKAWQQWGGERAREDLAQEAEVLATRTLASLPAPEPAAAAAAEADATTDTATDTAAPPSPPAPVAAPPALPRVKLDLQAHAEQIRNLRARWKELDRLGAQAGLPLWQRFDGALQTAYAPIAAQQAAVKAARADNLVQRQAMLDTLEALPEPLPADDGTPPDWRGLTAELDRFQQAWRKLGPPEHTVPAAARTALAQRLQAAVQRLEAPLQQARAQAATYREELITQAQALAPAGEPGPAAWDAPRLVRELQQQWQDHARQLPLQRGVETALWTRFKAATDAVFARRDAEAAARDAERGAALAEREALLAQLEALADTQPEDEITRTVADVDRGWRQAGEVPRAAQVALDRRLQAAHGRAMALLDALRRNRWQAQCDALAAQVDADDSAPPETTAQALPAAWAQAVAQRKAGAQLAPGLTPTGVDDLLLQLETLLEVPVAPALLEARRQHKLQALKQALEGRTGPATPRAPEQALTALLAQRGLPDAQRHRLREVVLALRRAAPDTLVPQRRR